MSISNAKYKKNPLKYAKNLKIITPVKVYHLCDYEGKEEKYIKQFRDIISNMKDVKKLGKQITYGLGYTNLTFDLWVILHKINCNGKITNKEDYIKYLNRAYNEKFQSMKEYKCEDNFKRCLAKLKMSDVIDAVKRAKFIMQENACNYILQEYKGYQYYTENPSLTVGNIVEKVLNECGITT